MTAVLEDGLMRIIRRLRDKNARDGGLTWTETTLIEFRSALADLRGRPIDGGVTAYYVLEDGKLRTLPLDIDAAIDLIREEFVAGHIHGTLCLRDVGGNDVGLMLHATGDRGWAMFEIEARAWLKKAIDIASRKGG